MSSSFVFFCGAGPGSGYRETIWPVWLVNSPIFTVAPLFLGFAKQTGHELLQVESGEKSWTFYLKRR